jgi:hypothetical protein
MRSSTSSRSTATCRLDCRVPSSQSARRHVPDRSKQRFAFVEQKQAEAFTAPFGAALHEVARRDW